MSEFNTSKQKLRTIWERIVKNDGEIANKDNLDKFEFFNNLLKQQNIKVPIKLFDSGDINLTPLTISNAFTAIKSESMPISVSYSKNIEIDVPEILLPFVKYSVEVNPLPDTEVRGVYEYDPSTWVGDNIEVRGDGTLIYKGQPIVTTSFTIPFGITHPESELIEKGISLTLTKETWEATIERADPLSNGFGKVTKVSGTIETTGLCGSNNDTIVFEIEHLDTKTHKITEMTKLSVTGIGRETITTYDVGCTPNVVINNNVTRTIIFATVDDYTINLAQATSLGLGFSKDDIENLEIEKTDRWLFYSTELQKIFKTLPGSPDGDFLEIELDNLPDTNAGDTLPYTSITLKRNLDGVNTPPIIQKQSEANGTAGEISETTLTEIANSGREFKNYLKTSPSNVSIPTYRFNLSGEFLIIAPSTVLNNDLVEFPVYNDIYTVVGTTYDLTTENHSLLSKDIWVPETQDITLNIKAYLVNPLYWREQRRYNKNDF